MGPWHGKGDGMNPLLGEVRWHESFGTGSQMAWSRGGEGRWLEAFVERQEAWILGGGGMDPWWGGWKLW